MQRICRFEIITVCREENLLPCSTEWDKSSYFTPSHLLQKSVVKMKHLSREQRYGISLILQEGKSRKDGSLIVFVYCSRVKNTPICLEGKNILYILVKIQEVHGGDDAASARWFPLSEIPSLAFDHDYILRMATQRLREEIHFHPVGFELLPEKFTLKELQALYEAILGISFDRRNFAKKMLHLEILTELDETVWPTPKREAKLYRFNPDKYEELKQKGFRLEF